MACSCVYVFVCKFFGVGWENFHCFFFGKMVIGVERYRKHENRQMYGRERTENMDIEFLELFFFSWNWFTGISGYIWMIIIEMNTGRAMWIKQIIYFEYFLFKLIKSIFEQKIIPINGINSFNKLNMHHIDGIVSDMMTMGINILLLDDFLHSPEEKWRKYPLRQPRSIQSGNKNLALELSSMWSNKS